MANLWGSPTLCIRQFPWPKGRIGDRSRCVYRVPKGP